MTSSAVEQDQLDPDPGATPLPEGNEEPYQKLARDIKDAIVAGEYRSGERLKESALTDKYKTNRTAIREALKILEGEGFIQPHPTQGYIVYNETLEDIEDIYQMREVVEGLAARLFTERALPEQVDALDIAILNFGEAAEHPEKKNELLQAKNHIYDVLLDGSGNKLLYASLQSLRDRISNLRRQTLSREGRPKRTFEELKAMFNAIESGDKEKAEQEAREHVKQAAKVAYSELRKRRIK